MHELSIAMSIMETVEKEALSNNAKAVSEIELDIGVLSGVDTDSLGFVLKNILKEGVFEKCNVKINSISSTLFCNDCYQISEFQVRAYECPICKSDKIKIHSGNELKIKSFLIET